MRDAGADLDAERGHGLAQRQDPVERRVVGGRVVPTAARGGASCRVGEEPVDALRGEVEGEAVAVPYLGVREVPQVHRRDGGGELVQVGREHRETEGGKRHRVAADAAREVRDAPAAGVGVALRVPGADGEAGRLLEARGREQHAVREVVELGPGLGPQAGLGQRRGDEARRDPLALEALGEDHREPLVVRRQGAEQGPAVRAQQLRQALGIHDADPRTARPPGRRRPGPGTTRWHSC